MLADWGINVPECRDAGRVPVHLQRGILVHLSPNQLTRALRGRPDRVMALIWIMRLVRFFVLSAQVAADAFEFAAAWPDTIGR